MPVDDNVTERAKSYKEDTCGDVSTIFFYTEVQGLGDTINK